MLFFIPANIQSRLFPLTFPLCRDMNSCTLHFIRTISTSIASIHKSIEPKPSYTKLSVSLLIYQYHLTINIYMKRFILVLIAFLSISFANAQLYFYESFDFVNEVISDDTPYNWKVVNASSPLGTSSAESWYQADMSMGINAYWGNEENSYIQADRFATSATTGGMISNWLISPSLILSNGDSVRFHAISYDSANHPDKIEVRISTLGEESILPTSANDVGSFNILIGAINPDLNTADFPSVNNGDFWSLYRFLVGGIGFGVNARVAIRYVVSDAGSEGPNGSAIGLDEFYIVGPEGYLSVPPSKNVSEFAVFPNPAHNHIFLPQENIQNGKITIYNINGHAVYQSEDIKQNNRIDISFLNRGMYILQSTSNGISQSSRFIKD